MGYSNNEGSVRIDFFTTLEGVRPGLQKWHMTDALDMGPFYNYPQIHDAFRAALAKHFKGAMTYNWRGREMEVICLEPYHEHAFPISLTLPQEEINYCETLYKAHLETVRLGS